MGYALGMGTCIGCGRVFGFNPMRVPSVFVNGNRKPICQDCVARVNPGRIKNGLQPIVPHPEAYEPCDEQELYIRTVLAAPPAGNTLCMTEPNHEDCNHDHEVTRHQHGRCCQRHRRH